MLRRPCVHLNVSGLELEEQKGLRYLLLKIFNTRLGLSSSNSLNTLNPSGPGAFPLLIFFQCIFQFFRISSPSYSLVSVLLVFVRELLNSSAIYFSHNFNCCSLSIIHLLSGAISSPRIFLLYVCVSSLIIYVH